MIYSQDDFQGSCECDLPCSTQSYSPYYAVKSGIYPVYTSLLIVLLWPLSFAVPIS